MQRIDGGKVTFLLDFVSPEKRKVVRHIAIKVMRTLNKNQDFSKQKELRDVFIESHLSLVQKSKVYFVFRFYDDKTINNNF